MQIILWDVRAYARYSAHMVHTGEIPHVNLNSQQIINTLFRLEVAVMALEEVTVETIMNQIDMSETLVDS